MMEELDLEKDQMIMMADSFKITTLEAYQLAGSLLTDMKSLEKKIESAFNPIVEAAHNAHKEAIKQRDVYLKPVALASAQVRGRMSAWITEENRKRQEEEKRINELNKRDGSEVVVQIDSPKVEGISTRKQYKYKVVDEKVIPDAYWCIDETKIQKEVNEKKGQVNIPGIEVYAVDIIITR